MSLTIISIFQRKGYPGDTLDWDTMGSNICKCLIFTGCLKVQGNSKEVANCERPKCDACEIGKGNHLPDKVKTTKNNLIKYQEINNNHIMPGQMVSVDPYISRYPVWL